jgi:hypothetical protein
MIAFAGSDAMRTAGLAEASETRFVFGKMLLPSRRRRTCSPRIAVRTFDLGQGGRRKADGHRNGKMPRSGVS